MKYKYLLTYILLIYVGITSGQKPTTISSSEIYQGLHKLNKLASVLYIAAHPDDENTTFISHFANQEHAETAYLSLTRGDGGQNLIGTEIRELLGVLRTQELLSARRIDGGRQYFTRANDFGYSKHPTETFNIWDKEEVTKDIVKVIREFQPDIIVTRFDHRTPGTTHGHHTASAILAVEAFEKASDENYLPQVTTWTPKSLFFNTSWWFYGGRDKFEEADKSEMYFLNVGHYYPSIGKSNNEISAESRSEHRCQGMGRLSARGEEVEYLELLKGQKPKTKNDILSGINTSWSRLKNGEDISKLISIIIKEYEISKPYLSVPRLITLKEHIENLEPSIWRSRKLEECEDLIIACSGLFIDTRTTSNFGVSNDSIDYEIEIVNRSPVNWKLNSVSTLGSDTTILKPLQTNQVYKMNASLLVSDNMKASTPYWLMQEGSLGMYTVNNSDYIGLPETPEPINFTFTFEVEGQKLKITRPLQRRIADPVKGEVYQPFEILEKVWIEPQGDIQIFKRNEEKEISIIVKAGKNNIQGVLKPLHVKEGWTITPSSSNFKLDNKMDQQTLNFTVKAPNNTSVNEISFAAVVNNVVYDKQLFVIDYSHILRQYVLQPCKIKNISIDLKYRGSKVGYIMGAGDKIPDALRTIGYQVDLLSPSNITISNLKNYDAIITGIRAYNTIDNIEIIHRTLLEYVQLGGVVINQYNTRHRLKSKDIGPYPIKLSRKRITDEFAKVEILAKDHPIFNLPNKIDHRDFDHWVQERGLYFPDEWDERYDALLSSKDDGEDSLEGGLLVAQYGKGYYIYNSYSLFRELPAGVPGAYRLLANMVSLGSVKK